MNLLLLLSALLSACTGVLGGGAPVSAPLAVSRDLGAQGIVARPTPAVASRPAAPIVTLLASADAPLITVQTVAAAQPLYAARRRE